MQIARLHRQLSALEDTFGIAAAQAGPPRIPSPGPPRPGNYDEDVPACGGEPAVTGTTIPFNHFLTSFGHTFVVAAIQAW